MTTATSSDSYFNLHVSGIGYLSRVRWVEPNRKPGRRGDRFLACAISAMRGPSDAVDYTYFDLRVSGQEAQEIVESLMEDVDRNRKVVVSFRVGDIYPHSYEREVRKDGRKTGEMEMAVLIKGRLLLISSVTVDGERVYTRESDGDTTPSIDHERDERGPVASSSNESLTEGTEPEVRRSAAGTLRTYRPASQGSTSRRDSSEFQRRRTEVPV